MTSIAPTSDFRPNRIYPLLLGTILVLVFCADTFCRAVETTATNAPAANSPAQTDQTPPETAQDLISKATQHMSDGNLDQAADEADRAIQLDPKNASAYELRGSIYIEKKFWDRAERDYTKADQISPDPVYKYKLGEIKYLQRSFGDARFHFAQIQKDPRLGDLASYKVFLCDFLGGHESIAALDLAAIDRGPKTPSFYFCHGVWASNHGSPQEANKYLVTAHKLYDKTTCDLYYQSLTEIRRFQPDVATFTTKDGKQFTNASLSMESDGLRVYTAQGWVTLPLDQLPDDLSGFPADVREEINRRRISVPSGKAPINAISFTTKAGKNYDNARWTLNDSGLSVLGPNGWVIVPFDQLPDNLSCFPPSVQNTIVEKRKTGPATPILADVISFTTKQGRQYEQVRAFATDTGLRVLSTNGWVEVSFDQLPSDVSAFPPDLQKVILEKRKAGTAASGVDKVISFTTKAGKQYDLVRATLTESGLRVLSVNGWVEVPFAQLPDELSPFPDEWWGRIRSGQQSGPSSSTGMTTVSFTTKSGKTYEQVRAAMGKNGLRLLTSDGFSTVPFDQLPDDVSVFPEDWRERIFAERKKSGSETTKPVRQTNE